MSGWRKLDGTDFWEHPLERDLNGLPSIIETPERFGDFYRSANFISVVQYGLGAVLLENEVGCLILLNGDRVLPVLRVCVIARGAKDSGLPKHKCNRSYGATK